MDLLSELDHSAYHQAQKTFKIFVRELSWERRRIIKTLDLAIVKISLRTYKSGSFPAYEYLWVKDFYFDGENVQGTLLNDPKWAKNYERGQKVFTQLSQVSDWMFATNGKAYGGFSIQNTRKRMTQAERSKHDRAWHLDFGDPTEPKLSYIDHSSEEDLLCNEHPMCRDMGKNFKEYLSRSKDLLNYKDRVGNSLLHIEALAGNGLIVKTLKEHGANIHLQNNFGQRPLDMARIFDWHNVIEVLEN
ncbi:DUF2314 domain-containing protein [Spirochaeta cellobiosiphila]|uniref:DUF2314 domain-containing protein n=1 Tax=Spirochaeta cellobiosiphila TaxID=504483 RepID=UPI00040060D7|nr:DUF2314 domain-containing protein [Spirochaeta cellobiosiphila]